MCTCVPCRHGRPAGDDGLYAGRYTVVVLGHQIKRPKIGLLRAFVPFSLSLSRLIHSITAEAAAVTLEVYEGEKN